MTKSQVKKTRLLHERSRDYRGHRSIADYKTRTNRIERRTQRQRLRTLSDGTAA